MSQLTTLSTLATEIKRAGSVFTTGRSSHWSSIEVQQDPGKDYLLDVADPSARSHLRKCVRRVYTLGIELIENIISDKRAI